MSRIRNIVLDMGNVLFDYNPKAMTDYFLPNGSKEDKELFLQEFFNKEEWNDRDLGILTDEEVYESVAKRLPARLHEPLRQCLQHWEKCMVPFEEAREFVRYIREKGYGLYVLSNASTTFYAYFPKFSPLYWFDGIVISSDIHLLKPDPAIYKYLLTKYGLKPEQCLFIDDRADNVEGARAVGMEAAVFKENWQEIQAQFSL